MKALIFGNKKISYADLQGMEQRGVNEIIRVANATVLGFEYRLVDPDHLLHDWEFVDLAQRDAATRLILIPLNVVDSGFMYKDLTAVAPRELLQGGEVWRHLGVVFQADKDIGINQESWRAHIEGLLASWASRRGRIGVARS